MSDMHGFTHALLAFAATMRIGLNLAVGNRQAALRELSLRRLARSPYELDRAVGLPVMQRLWGSDTKTR